MRAEELGPAKAVEPLSLVAGGLFMGINFLLLSSGIRWVLTPRGSPRFSS